MNNMYTLNHLNARHEQVRTNLDYLRNELEQIRAARYYSIQRESRYNDSDEIREICTDYRYLDSLEVHIDALIRRMTRIHDGICMARLRHPEFEF
jgi:hypothetical protein